MPQKKRHALPSEVAQKYQLTSPWFGSPEQYFPRFGTINVTELTIEKADRLFAKGWKRLKLKPQSAISSSKGADKKSK